MPIFLITLCFCYFFGSLPLSLWLGKFVLHKDILQYGDHNPGAANVWRAAGSRWGLFAVILDFLKGAIPVGIANFGLGLVGWQLVAIAMATLIGSAFSPFLGFRGGKSISITFGIWCGLSLWMGPLLLGVSFAFWLALLTIPGWAILAGMSTFLGLMLLIGFNPVYLAFWVGSFVVLIWTHREDYRTKVPLEDGILGRLRSNHTK